MTLTGLIGETRYEVRVRAVNSHGDGRWSRTRELSTGAATAPKAVPGLSATQRGPLLTIALAWSAPADDGGAPVGYKVEVSDGRNSWSTLATKHSGTSYTHTYTASSRGTTLRYRVSAVNKVGAGVASTVAQVTIRNHAPVAINSTMSATEDVYYVFPRKAFLFTDAENDALANVKIVTLPTNGILIDSLDGSVIESGSLPKTVASSNLNHLNYLASPRNANGTGYASFTFKVNDGTDDSANTATMTVDVSAVNDAPEFDPSTAVRSFDENTAPGGAIGGALTATDVDVDTLTYSLMGTDAASFAIDSASGQLKTRTGVTYDYEAKSSYSVTVVASDDSESDRIGVTVTLNDVDEPPLAPALPSLSAVTGTGSKLLLSWTAPSNPGRPAILHYDVQYRQGTTGEWTSGPQDQTGASVTLTGLVGATLYQVQVRATNDEGDGQWSASAQGTTGAATAPTAPGSLAAASSGRFDIALSWRVPADDGGVSISGYKVEVSSNGSNGWSTPAAKHSGTSYAHTGLAPGSTRHYRVSAVNDVGAGAASAVAQATTDANRAPVATSKTVSTNEDTAYTFGVPDFPFTDADSDTLVSVKVVELPTNGTLSLNSAVIESGSLPKTVTKANLDANKLVYSPPADANGTDYASFTFKVNDGYDDSAAAATMTVDVSAVNDAPVAATMIPDQTATVGTAFSYAFSTGTFSDVDSGDTLTYRATKGDGTALPDWLSFTRGSRTFVGTPQSTDVETLAVKVTASDGTATVSDTFNIVVSPATVVSIAGGAAVTEGTSASFTLTAAPAPTGNITVHVTVADSGAFAGTSQTGARTVTIGTGGTGTLTVTTAGDQTDEPNGTVTATVKTGTSYSVHGTNGSATVTITDDDATPQVTLALMPDSIGENGGVSTITATLDRASSEETTVTVVAAADYTLTPNKELTIAAGATTSSGTVTLTAVDNNVDAPDKTVTVSARADNSQGVTAPSNVTLTITDDDATPQVTLALMPDSIGENGGVSTITATLDRASSEETTVTVSASADSPAVSADYRLTNNKELTIAAGAKASSGVVTLTGVNNDVDALDKTVTVSAMAGNSQGAMAPADVTLTITDDDSAGVTVSKSALTITEGGSGSYTVKLNTQPSGNVSITLSSNNTDVTLPTTLAFTTGDWDTAQTVSVSAAEDADAANDSATVTHTVSGYGSVSASPVTVTVTDDDTAGVTVSKTTLTIAEGGSGSYTVVLDTQPSGNVSITLSSNNTDVTLSQTTLAFTSSNWDTAKTVTVRAGQDADAANDSASVTHTVSGYGSVSVSPVTVTVTDDDTAGVTVSKSALTIAEGGSGSYTVKLNTQPSGNVSITPSSNNTDVTLSAQTLTFTSSDWDSAKTVTVRAAQDTDAQDDSAEIRHSASGGGYTNVTVASVAVTVDDDDTASTGVTLSVDPATVGEGDSATEVTVTATLNGRHTEFGHSGSGDGGFGHGGRGHGFRDGGQLHDHDCG